MGVGLLAFAAAVFYGSHLFFEHQLDPDVIRSAMAPVLVGVVLLATAAAFVGAWWLAGSAVRPVAEITEQATKIEAGTLSQRIAAHAETGEYRGLVAVLNRMLERLDVAFRTQRRLTADVSHELRSPLTALQGEIEVALRAERTPRDYQRVLHSALEEIERLTEMSEDLLLITRIDAIEIRGAEVAHAIVAVGMLGRDSDAAWDLAADIYRFDLLFAREDGEWRVTRADWRAER